MLQSYAQFREDIDLLEFFKPQSSGYYIDVGAFDGVSSSNTFLLEQAGWHGLSIEANPDLILSLQKSRPHCTIVAQAVTAPNKIGIINFYKVVSDYAKHLQLSTTQLTSNLVAKIASRQGKFATVQVPATTLDDILERHQVPLRFDVLSIDVSGSELNALKGFSIEKFQPRIVIVADYTSGTGDAVSKYLTSYGYLRAYRTVMNDWYVRPEDISFFRSKQIEVVRQHEEWQVHSLFGLAVKSNFPWSYPLALATETPDLSFTCTSEAPLTVNLLYLQPICAGSPLHIDGQYNWSIYHINDCFVLRFSDGIDYYIWCDRIVCHLRDPLQSRMVEVGFISSAMAFWMEQQDRIALHASAVVVAGKAVGFLANKGTGKTLLAVILMQLGYPLLTDDILPIFKQDQHFLGYPGYPLMRIWLDEASYLLGDDELAQNLEFVHPSFAKRRLPVGSKGFDYFCETPQPLACLYLPERRDPNQWGTEIVITPVSPQPAIIELIRYSFAASKVKAIGTAAQRLTRLTQIAQEVPIRRLIYPSGFEHIPCLQRAILDDLEDITQVELFS
ncbi:MAG: FkbM family methyltransferase [Aphanothece sp. CMT-3BRIN-NPC111]|jgi:FkbM family methyltransferase|nr:FkbM family methyltransferase [Aphanothece sp. CMT-3BRIN-NPC111]